MAAVNALTIRDAVVHQLVRREKSWPAREPGVMVVFCITFVVGVALIGLWINKCLKARKERTVSKSEV